MLFRLILQPAKTWADLSEKQEDDNENFFKSYLYPILGLIALLSFAGIFISTKEFNLQLALKTVISQLLIYFAGFYLASYALSEILFRFFQREKDIKLSQRFVGYSSALIYLVSMIQSLFPAFFFLELLVFYTIYMIWIGSFIYMKIAENEQVKFTVWASVIILFSPQLIELIVYLLMPGLRS